MGYFHFLLPVPNTMVPLERPCSSISILSSFDPLEGLSTFRKFPNCGSVRAFSGRHFTVFQAGLSSPLSSTKFFKNRGGVIVNAQNEGPSSEDEASEASLQATVQHSKKVLALQKELLQQIAERRKLVLSLKDKLGGSSKQAQYFNEDNSSEDDVVLGKNEETEVQENFSEESLANLSNTTSAEFLSEDQTLPGSVPDMKRFNALEISGRPSVSSSTSSPKSLLSTTLGMPSVLGTTSEDLYDSVKEPGPEPEIETDAKAEITTASGEGEAKPPPLAGTNVMNIIVVAAECAPWSKTGGLGDVVGALPKALARRGHRVMVVAPRYSDYREGQDTGVHKRYRIHGQDFEVGYYQAYIDNVDFVFINSPIFKGFNNNIYQGNREDILKRMVLFCKAAVEVPWQVPCGGVCYGDGNLVFVANDWHTALLPVYLQAYYRDHGLMKYTRSVLVIHNIAHQGRGPLDDYKFLDLPEHYMDCFKLYDPVGGEHLNIFMAGLKTAHQIVAVSHGYSWECQTSEGGWGLHEVVKENAWKLRGIVNGIDNNDWSPELDVHLKNDGYVNYSIETLETGKATCKTALQKELGLPVRSDVPVIGFIGRLDYQKGVDIIAESMHWIVQQDIQLVMLGTGRSDLENMLRSFEGHHPDKVRGWVGFSVRTAHRFTAGCDILLMPSRFEPCGLNQLYAMRYGTVPVVHAVGGLKDTVKPFDPFSETGLGWTFECAESSRLIHALGNALWTYRDFKQSWRGIQKRGMSQDLSWDNAAKQYEEVFLAAKYQW